MGQFAKLAQDEARDKKKLAKKEQLERSKEELSKVIYPPDTVKMFTINYYFRLLLFWL